ncbi:hypothetical protein INR49_006493 [Caranx melampygus]|nr:hypothetical protein INR49_006493 [Caranx melampygus]
MDLLWLVAGREREGHAGEVMLQEPSTRAAESPKRSRCKKQDSSFMLCLFRCFRDDGGRTEPRVTMSDDLSGPPSFWPHCYGGFY